MICISIAQQSRRFALADMKNAAKQCDLLELRLDRFKRAPDVGELIAAKPKPLILSCRRQKDGGEWDGTEDERLALLRQCIISKADYIEIELDAADQIRKFPPSKRVISYTNFQETPKNIAAIYAEAQAKGADVVKLVTLARTPEDAWPLVQIMAKPALPTVVVGLGKPGIMLTILGKKIGAPWTYAALERGMEAYPGEPSVADLRTIYHYDSINRATPFIGVTGLGEQETLTAAVLNAAMAHLHKPTRALPLQVGDVSLLRKVLKAVKADGVFIDAANRGAMIGIATELRPDAEQAQAIDTIVWQKEKWFGFNLVGRAAIGVLEKTLSLDPEEKKPLEGRQVMIVGADSLARALAFRIQRRGGALIIACRDREKGRHLAQDLEGRFVPFEALYTTMHDVLVVASEERQPVSSKAKTEEPAIHAGFLTSGMTVMDLTSMPHKSSFLRAAEAHGCKVVAPDQVLMEHLLLQLRAVVGDEVPAGVVEEVLNGFLTDAD